MDENFELLKLPNSIPNLTDEIDRNFSLPVWKTKAKAVQERRGN